MTINTNKRYFPLAPVQKTMAALTFRLSGAACSNVGPRAANDGRREVFGEGPTKALATKFGV